MTNSCKDSLTEANEKHKEAIKKHEGAEKDHKAAVKEHEEAIKEHLTTHRQLNEEKTQLETASQQCTIDLEAE